MPFLYVSNAITALKIDNKKRWREVVIDSSHKGALKEKPACSSLWSLFLFFTCTPSNMYLIRHLLYVIEVWFRIRFHYNISAVMHTCWVIPYYIFNGHFHALRKSVEYFRDTFMSLLSSSTISTPQTSNQHLQCSFYTCFFLSNWFIRNT